LRTEANSARVEHTRSPLVVLQQVYFFASRLHNGMRVLLHRQGGASSSR
jgi:hypothetical protein